MAIRGINGLRGGLVFRREHRIPWKNSRICGLTAAQLYLHGFGETPPPSLAGFCGCVLYRAVEMLQGDHGKDCALGNKNKTLRTGSSDGSR